MASKAAIMLLLLALLVTAASAAAIKVTSRKDSPVLRTGSDGRKLMGKGSVLLPSMSAAAISAISANTHDSALVRLALNNHNDRKLMSGNTAAVIPSKIDGAIVGGSTATNPASNARIAATDKVKDRRLMRIKADSKAKTQAYAAAGMAAKYGGDRKLMATTFKVTNLPTSQVTTGATVRYNAGVNLP